MINEVSNETDYMPCPGGSVVIEVKNSFCLSPGDNPLRFRNKERDGGTMVYMSRIF